MSSHNLFNTLFAILLVLTLSLGSPIGRELTSLKSANTNSFAKRNTVSHTEEFTDGRNPSTENNNPYLEVFYDERAVAETISTSSKQLPSLTTSSPTPLTPTSTTSSPALEHFEVQKAEPSEQPSTTATKDNLIASMAASVLSPSADDVKSAISISQDHRASSTANPTGKKSATEGTASYLASSTQTASTAQASPSSRFQSSPTRSLTISDFSDTPISDYEIKNKASTSSIPSVTQATNTSLKSPGAPNTNSSSIDLKTGLLSSSLPTPKVKNATSDVPHPRINHSISMKSCDTAKTGQSFRTSSSQPTKIYSAIPHPTVDPLDTKNAVPMPELELAFEYTGEQEGAGSTRTAEILAKWNKEAVALDNMGGLRSVKCNPDFIDIQFQDSNMAEVARSRWSADLFYLLSNRDGCQNVEEPHADLVKKATWSSDGLSVRLYKEDVPFEDALEEYKGSFGVKIDQPDSFRPSLDEMLARKHLPNLQKLPNPNQWNDEQRASVEDLLYLNKMAGQLVMQNLQSDASAPDLRQSDLDSHRFARPRDFQKRGLWNWLKKAIVRVVQMIQKGIPEAIKAIWNGIVEFAENLAELLNTRTIDKTYIFQEALTDHLELATASPWENSVELLNFEPSGAELVIYCVDCNFEFVFDLKGKFDLDILAGRYGVSVDFEGDLDTTIVFGIHAKTLKYDLERSISVISFPLGPIAFPGFNLGPQIGLNLGASLSIDAEGEIKIGARVEVLDMVLHASAGSLLQEQKTPESWETSITNKCSANARIELSGSLFAEVVLEFSAQLLKWKIATGAKARFLLDASAKAQLNYNSQDGIGANIDEESGSRLSMGIWSGKGHKPMKGSKPPQKAQSGTLAKSNGGKEEENEEDSKVSDNMSTSDKKVGSDFSCENGVVFQLSLNWKLEMFAGDYNYEIDLSGVVPQSFPIVEPVCLFQLAKRDGETGEGFNIASEEMVKLALSADAKNHVYASEIGTLFLTNSTDDEATTPFSIKSQEKPEGIAAAAARDEKGRSFAVFDFISTTGVSNIQMYSDRDLPEGAFSTTLIQSEEAVFIMNEAKEELYNLVVCATALGAQLFAYSEKAFPSTELTGRINEKFSFNFASIEDCSIPQLSLNTISAPF